MKQKETIVEYQQEQSFPSTAPTSDRGSHRSRGSRRRGCNATTANAATGGGCGHRGGRGSSGDGRNAAAAAADRRRGWRRGFRFCRDETRGCAAVVAEDAACADCRPAAVPAAAIPRRAARSSTGAAARGVQAGGGRVKYDA